MVPLWQNDNMIGSKIYKALALLLFTSILLSSAQEITISGYDVENDTVLYCQAKKIKTPEMYIKSLLPYDRQELLNYNFSNGRLDISAQKVNSSIMLESRSSVFRLWRNDNISFYSGTVGRNYGRICWFPVAMPKLGKVAPTLQIEGGNRYHNSPEYKCDEFACHSVTHRLLTSCNLMLMTVK